MTGSLFLSFDSSRIARGISGAERSVSYAAPGILPEPAEALAADARGWQRRDVQITESCFQDPVLDGLQIGFTGP